MASAWFGAPPPDLSVEARVRGKDWLYSYLLALLQGREVDDRLEQPGLPERRDAARAVESAGHAATRRDRVRGSREGRSRGHRRQGLAVAERLPNGKYVVKTLANRHAGNVVDGRVPEIRGRPGQLPGLHGGAGAQRTHQHRHHRAHLSWLSCSFSRTRSSAPTGKTFTDAQSGLRGAGAPLLPFAFWRGAHDVLPWEKKT